MDKGKFVELFPKMVVIYLGLATAVTMKTIDLTKNQEIQLLSQLLIEVVFCYLFKITKIRHKSEKNWSLRPRKDCLKLAILWKK